MEQKKYIRPNLIVVTVCTRATIAATSGNLSNFTDNELDFEDLD